MQLGSTGKVDQRAKRGFDGTCEVESGLFVKLDSMALCCLWSAKVRAGEISRKKRHTCCFNFLSKKGFADELCVLCTRVGAGEGGGGKDTADIETASCVFFCLHGGQWGKRLEGGDGILARRSKVSLVADMAQKQASGSWSTV